MAKRIMSAVMALLGCLVFVTMVVAAEPFKWTDVGGDPCNPKAGCTFKWFLGKIGWPQDVQLALLAKVKGTSPETIAITSGLNGSNDPAWRGAMGWGKFTPKFEPDVIAAWPDGQYQPASHWTHESGDKVYHLIKVQMCGNPGGWITPVPKPPKVVEAPPKVAEVTLPSPAPNPPPKEEAIPLGNLPVVACP